MGQGKEEERKGERKKEKVCLSSVSARDEAIPKAITELTHCTNLNGNPQMGSHELFQFSVTP